MSCGCNTNPCSCQPHPSVCCAPTTESVEYTFENQNLSGVGVFNGEVNNLVGFRGIVSESVALTVALDAPNNVIVLDFDDSQLIAAIPDATTTQRGILETATDAEAIAKALNNKILTPSNLAALGGTTSFAGFLELATNAEAIAGVSTTLAVTPAGLAAAGALNGTVTFTDAVARGAAVPAFAGQFGTQLDTDQGFVANGTSAGDWVGLLTLGVTSTMYGSTTVNLNGGSFIYSGGSLNIDGTTTTTWNGPLAFDNAGVTFINASTLNLDSDTTVSFEGTPALNDTLFGFSPTAEPEAIPINLFISDYNQQTGWAVTNPSVSRTLDVAAATLGDVRAVLGTLINDLKARLLPST